MDGGSDSDIYGCQGFKWIWGGWNWGGWNWGFERIWKTEMLFQWKFSTASSRRYKPQMGIWFLDVDFLYGALCVLKKVTKFYLYILYHFRMLDLWQDTWTFHHTVFRALDESILQWASASST